MSFRSKKNKHLLIGLLLSLSYTIMFMTGTNVSPTLEDVSVLGVIALFQLVYIIASWWYIRKSFFDAYIIFVFVLYAFNLGQPILETFGLASEFRRLWDGYDIPANAYYRATYFSTLFIMFFHLGAVWSLKPVTFSDLKTLGVRESIEIDSVRRASIFICIISAPFYLYNLVHDMLVVRMAGYTGLYEAEEGSRIVGILADLFAPAMMAYFCACLLQKNNVRMSGFLVVALLILPPLYLGGRSNAMIIVALVLIVYASIRTINVRKFLIIGTLAVSMLFLMHIIAVTRTETGQTLSTWQTATEDSDNPVVSTINEMGWTMYPLALTIDAVPKKKEYAYGASYFWAFVSLIPNVGIWNGIHPGKKNDPGYWLNEYSSLNYGIGYSLTAGAYNELGPFGFILMFLYGWFFCLIFSYVSSVHVYKSPLKFIFALLFLWFAIKFVRNSYDSFMRNIVYDVLPMYLLTKMIVKQHMSRVRNRVRARLRYTAS